jgi:sec-independent protein translocase protein TatA
MWDSPMHLLIIAVVILVLFGGRKIPEVMRGLGQGVREFKEGMRGDQPAQSTESAGKSAGLHFHRSEKVAARSFRQSSDGIFTPPWFVPIRLLARETTPSKAAAPSR